MGHPAFAGGVEFVSLWLCIWEVNELIGVSLRVACGTGVGSADAQMRRVYASVHVLILSVPAPFGAQSPFYTPLLHAFPQH